MSLLNTKYFFILFFFSNYTQESVKILYMAEKITLKEGSLRAPTLILFAPPWSFSSAKFRRRLARSDNWTQYQPQFYSAIFYLMLQNGRTWVMVQLLYYFQCNKRFMFYQKYLYVIGSF